LERKKNTCTAGAALGVRDNGLALLLSATTILPAGKELLVLYPPITSTDSASAAAAPLARPATPHGDATSPLQNDASCMATHVLTDGWIESLLNGEENSGNDGGG
jgi:hypothetical protein